MMARTLKLILLLLRSVELISCHDSELFQDIAFHSDPLDQELAHDLEAVPSSVIQGYPHWNESEIEILPIEILLRIPVIKLHAMDLDPEFLGNLVRERPFDYLLLDRILSLLRSNPRRIGFFDGLEDSPRGVPLPARTWSRLGSLLSGWWTHWDDLIRELLDHNSFSSYRLLLELPLSAYLPCAHPPKAELCVAKNVKFTEGNEQKRNELLLPSRALVDHFHNLEGNEQIFRFRFWNSILQERLGQNFSGFQRPIPVELSSHFMFALYPNQLESLWRQSHRGTDSPLRYEDLPLLWFLSDMKMEPFGPSLANFEMEISKYLNITQQIMSLQPSRGELFTGELNFWLSQKTMSNFPKFIRGSNQVEAMLMERLCTMSMKEVSNLPLHLLSTLPPEFFRPLETCLNPGQKTALANKFENIHALPPFLRRYLFVEKFEGFQDTLSEEELLEALKTAPMSPEQELIVYDRFKEHLLINLNSDWLDKLLNLPNPTGILRFVAPGDLAWNTSALLTNISSWNTLQKARLTKLPPVLASQLLSEAPSLWTPKSRLDAMLMSVGQWLIHGLNCYHIPAIPLISIERIASTFMERVETEKWISPLEIITCSCLRERLSQFQILSNQTTSLVMAQLEAVSKLSSSSEAANVEGGICLQSHLFLPSDLSKMGFGLLPSNSQVEQEEDDDGDEADGFQPWQRLHLARIFPYLSKRNVIKMKQTWKTFGVPLSWSSEDLIQFGPSISLLPLERFQMDAEQRSSLSRALKAVMQESSYFQTELLASSQHESSCFSEEFKDKMDNLLSLYLRPRLALGATNPSRPNGLYGRFISKPSRDGHPAKKKREIADSGHTTTRPEQQVTTASSQLPQHRSPHQHHEHRGGQEADKPQCDFTNLTFTRELFNFTLKLAKRNLESDLIRPIPQIGPLVMDVVEQRRTILKRVLNINLRMRNNELYDEVTFEFEDHEVNAAQRDLIEEAFNDIYIKAVKRLVVTANIVPENLTPMSCGINDMDLFIIFPLSIMSNLYDRDIWMEHKNYSLEQILENGLMFNATESDTDSQVLTILNKGSDAYSAPLISTEELDEATSFMAHLFTAVMQAYNLRLNSSSTVSNWNKVGTSAKLEYRVATEKRGYFNRLKRIFRLRDLFNEEIAIVIQNEMKNPEKKAIFAMENLRYQFRIIRSLIRIAKIKAGDLERRVLLEGPSEVVLDLFPDFEGVSPVSEATPITMSNVITPRPEATPEVTPIKLNFIPQATTSMPMTTPSSLAEDGNPGQVLACSFGLLPIKECKTNPLFTNYKEILEEELNSTKLDPSTYLKWREGDQPSISPQEGIFVQALYLTVSNHVNQKAQSGSMGQDDQTYIRLFMDKKRRNFLLFLKIRNISLPQISGLDNHALRQMLSISKVIVDELEVTPEELNLERGLGYPVLKEVFRTYISTGVKQNPELHELMCENHLLQTLCVDDDESSRAPNHGLSDDAKVSKLYNNVLDLVEKKKAVGTMNETMIQLVEKVKIQAQNKLERSLAEAMESSLESDFKLEPMKILHANMDQDKIQMIKANLTEYKLRIAQYFINGLKLQPQDLGLNKTASKDESMRRAFRWYYVKMSTEQRRILFQVDALFKEAKRLLKSKPLTQDQIHEIRTLQKKVNKDSAIVAEKYLNINATGRENQVATILAKKVKAGNLSEIVIDEVNEFALLQKVYIIMRLVHIIDLSKRDFSSELLAQIPKSYHHLIFGDESKENQIEMPTPQALEVTERPMIMTKHLESPSMAGGRSTSKSKRESEAPSDGAKTLESRTLSNIAFFLYHRAVSIATYKKSQGQMSIENIQELNSVLDSQQANIVERLRNMGNNGSITSGSSNQVGFVVLKGTMSSDQSEAVNQEIIKIQLRSTKQIVLLLDLTPKDFQINSNFVLTSGIRDYLFGQSPNIKGRTNTYLNAVNLIYVEIRKILTKFAHKGRLNSMQTITAKNIIHDLNKESVADMVLILQLSQAELHPDNLIKLIQAKLNSQTMTEEEQSQIKLVIYQRKLKAIQQFVLLLALNEADLRISTTLPEDLIHHIFNSDGLKALARTDEQEDGILQVGSLYQSQEDIYGVFCMSCFHRLYMQWKKDHNIDQGEDEPEEPLVPEKRMLGEKESDFIVKSLGFLTDDLNDIIVVEDDYDLPAEKLMRSLKPSSGLQALNHVGTILHLYQKTADMGSKMNLSQNIREEFNRLLDSQEQMIYLKLPGVIGNATYTIKSQSFGIIIETNDIEAHRKRALEDFIYNFHLTMTRKMIQLLGLAVDDFDDSIHIPHDLEDALFVPVFEVISSGQIANMDQLLQFLRSTVEERNAMGLLFDHEAQKIRETMDQMDHRIRGRLDHFTTFLPEDMTLSEIYGRLESGPIAPDDLDELKEANFMDMIHSLKVVVQILELEAADVPNMSTIDFQILDALFNSMSDSDEAFLELLHERPKVKTNLDSGKIGRQIDAVRGRLAGRVMGSNSGGDDDYDVEIPAIDFTKPNDGSSGDEEDEVDVRKYLAHVRDKRASWAEGIPLTCQELRSAGVKRAHLSLALFSGMASNEIRNCMDIIQNLEPLQVWLRVVHESHLSQIERLYLFQKVPALLIQLNGPEMGEEFLTKLGRNFQFSSPALCLEMAKTHSDGDIEKNVPIPSVFLHLLRIPCVFLYPKCASYSRLLERSSSSSVSSSSSPPSSSSSAPPSVILNGRNSPGMTRRNPEASRKALEMTELSPDLTRLAVTRATRCPQGPSKLVDDQVAGGNVSVTPEDVGYSVDKGYSPSFAEVSIWCQSGAIRGWSKLEVDTQVADAILSEVGCLEKLPPIVRDRLIGDLGQRAEWSSSGRNEEKTGASRARP